MRCLLLLLFCVPLAHAQLRPNCTQLKEQIDAGEGNPSLFFRAASCLARNQEIDEAFAMLSLAADSGFREVDQLRRDGGIARLTRDARFAPLLAKVKENQESFNNRFNRELYDLFLSAQADNRKPGNPFSERDKVRLARVSALVEAGQLKEVPDYLNAGEIYLNGNELSHFEKAQSMAREALKLDQDSREAKQLLYRAEDRLLHANGKPQIWGTHFHRVDGTLSLEPFDRKAKSDAERVAVGLPTLEDVARHLQQLQHDEHHEKGHSHNHDHGHKH